LVNSVCSINNNQNRKSKAVRKTTEIDRFFDFFESIQTQVEAELRQPDIREREIQILTVQLEAAEHALANELWDQPASELKTEIIRLNRWIKALTASRTNPNEPFPSNCDLY
jgi:hypothetical protein